MFRQIFLIPVAGLTAFFLSIAMLTFGAAPTQAGPLSSSGLIGGLADTDGDTILVAEGNRRPRLGNNTPRVQEGNRQPRKARPTPAKRRAATPQRKPRNAEKRRVRNRDNARRRDGARRDGARRDGARRNRDTTSRPARTNRNAHNKHRRKHRNNRRHRHSGFGGFYGGVFLNDRFYDGYDPYYDEPIRRKITCVRARKLVSRKGYRRVRAYDCRGEVYGFHARKGKRRYRVRISAYTSRILSVSRVRASR